MARIIHRFRWPGSKHGLAGFNDPGLVLLLDPSDVAEDPQLGGRMVRVIPPDGAAFEVQVSRIVETGRHGGLALRIRQAGVDPGGRSN